MGDRCVRLVDREGRTGNFGAIHSGKSDEVSAVINDSGGHPHSEFYRPQSHCVQEHFSSFEGDSMCSHELGFFLTITSASTVALLELGLF